MTTNEAYKMGKGLAEDYWSEDNFDAKDLESFDAFYFAMDDMYAATVSSHDLAMSQGKSDDFEWHDEVLADDRLLSSFDDGFMAGAKAVWPEAQKTLKEQG